MLGVLSLRRELTYGTCRSASGGTDRLACVAWVLAQGLEPVLDGRALVLRVIDGDFVGSDGNVAKTKRAIDGYGSAVVNGAILQRTNFDRQAEDIRTTTAPMNNFAFGRREDTTRLTQ